VNHHSLHLPILVVCKSILNTCRIYDKKPQDCKMFIFLGAKHGERIKKGEEASKEGYR
jgi:Fe-S-cluster containining protein